jgi:type I restriction enzyme S subunit
MSFHRYPAYKESGIKWLGQIPSHWETIQSRRIFKARREAAKEDDTMLTASQKYGMIPQADFVEKEGRRVVEVIQGKDNLIHVEPNDFVISMRSFQGGLEWCRFTGSTSFHYVPVTPIKHVAPGFFAHLFKSHQYISALRSTTNLIRDGQEIRYSNFIQVPLPVIPKEEQLAIASFLDRETAKIDALIAEQQRLIGLLHEKRQAVISHAVTKGLNPETPMKDSGVEWLGEVPENWRIIKLSYAAEVIDPNPSHRNPEYTDEGFPFISTQEFLSGGLIELNTSRRVSESIVLEQEASCNFQPGSIAFSRKGTIGETRILPTNTRLALLDSLCVINPQTSVDPEFIMFFISGTACRAQLDLIMRGAALPQVSIGDVRFLRIALPSLTEQASIVFFLNSQSSEYEALVETTKLSIQLLQERRSALISAAVTGQIDVRGAGG